MEKPDKKVEDVVRSLFGVKELPRFPQRIEVPGMQLWTPYTIGLFNTISFSEAMDHPFYDNGFDPMDQAIFVAEHPYCDLSMTASFFSFDELIKLVELSFKRPFSHCHFVRSYSFHYQDWQVTREEGSFLGLQILENSGIKEINLMSARGGVPWYPADRKPVPIVNNNMVCGWCSKSRCDRKMNRVCNIHSKRQINKLLRQSWYYTLDLKETLCPCFSPVEAVS